MRAERELEGHKMERQARARAVATSAREDDEDGRWFLGFLKRGEIRGYFLVLPAKSFGPKVCAVTFAAKVYLRRLL